MDKLEQENIDELIMRQTGDGSSNKVKVTTVEEDDTTMESLRVSCNVIKSKYRFCINLFLYIIALIYYQKIETLLKPDKVY